VLRVGDAIHQINPVYRPDAGEGAQYAAASIFAGSGALNRRARVDVREGRSGGALASKSRNTVMKRVIHSALANFSRVW